MRVVIGGQPLVRPWKAREIRVGGVWQWVLLARYPLHDNTWTNKGRRCREKRRDFGRKFTPVVHTSSSQCSLAQELPVVSGAEKRSTELSAARGPGAGIYSPSVISYSTSPLRFEYPLLVRNSPTIVRPLHTVRVAHFYYLLCCTARYFSFIQIVFCYPYTRRQAPLRSFETPSPPVPFSPVTCFSADKSCISRQYHALL
jgi:hypothetical protein